MQDLKHVLEAITKVQEDLAKVRCGPQPEDDHNITNVDLPAFTRALVGLVRQGARIIAGLGFVHHHQPAVFESELQEVLDLTVARAACTAATFELHGAPSIKGEEWPPFPETEAMNTQPRRIKGRRRQAILNRATKVAGSLRLRKRRPPPRYDATYPPVANSDLLTKPETIRGWLTFKMIPDLRYEKVPESLRWRHFALLTGVPHFPPGSADSPGGFYRRYFRYVTSLLSLLTFISI